MGAADLPEGIAALSFEEALGELEKIVRQLEEGEAKLDDAIGLYERGSHLKRHCEAKLAEAKAKIEKITLGPGGDPRTEPMETN
ncbi:MAG: exodeoxyribonuclease VII small subunit [Alphaproteobacteria bacterium]|nr:exodeoxyribonuclease VII small subunit [Alphaproteobacteria bacterium]